MKTKTKTKSVTSPTFRWTNIGPVSLCRRGAQYIGLLIRLGKSRVLAATFGNIRVFQNTTLRDRNTRLHVEGSYAIEDANKREVNVLDCGGQVGQSLQPAKEPAKRETPWDYVLKYHPARVLNETESSSRNCIVDDYTGLAITQDGTALRYYKNGHYVAACWKSNCPGVGFAFQKGQGFRVTTSLFSHVVWKELLAVAQEDQKQPSLGRTLYDIGAATFPHNMGTDFNRNIWPDIFNKYPVRILTDSEARNRRDIPGFTGLATRRDGIVIRYYRDGKFRAAIWQRNNSDKIFFQEGQGGYIRQVGSKENAWAKLNEVITRLQRCALVEKELQVRGLPVTVTQKPEQPFPYVQVSRLHPIRVLWAKYIEPNLRVSVLYAPERFEEQFGDYTGWAVTKDRLRYYRKGSAVVSVGDWARSKTPAFYVYEQNKRGIFNPVATSFQDTAWKWLQEAINRPVSVTDCISQQEPPKQPVSLELGEEVPRDHYLWHGFNGLLNDGARVVKAPTNGSDTFLDYTGFALSRNIEDMPRLRFYAQGKCITSIGLNGLPDKWGAWFHENPIAFLTTRERAWNSILSAMAARCSDGEVANRIIAQIKPPVTEEAVKYQVPAALYKVGEQVPDNHPLLRRIGSYITNDPASTIVAKWVPLRGTQDVPGFTGYGLPIGTLRRLRYYIEGKWVATYTTHKSEAIDQARVSVPVHGRTEHQIASTHTARELFRKAIDEAEEKQEAKQRVKLGAESAGKEALRLFKKIEDLLGDRERAYKASSWLARKLTKREHYDSQAEIRDLATVAFDLRLRAQENVSNVSEL